jgi:serine phosphatase RsbU (regulator of sigma subunit)/CHASE3 domain sensor protein
VWIIVLFLVVAVFLAASLRIRASVAGSFEDAQRVRSARTLTFAATKAQLDEETGVRGYAATHDFVFLQPYHESSGALRPALDALAPLLDELQVAPAAEAALADARQANDTWLRAVAVPLIANPARTNAASLEMLGKRLVDRFRADIARIDQSLTQLDVSIRRQSDTGLAQLGELIAVTTLVLLAVSISFVAAQTRAWRALERERDVSEATRLSEQRTQLAYETEKHVAVTLQEALSQRNLPALPSMRFSATYMAAAWEANVGGDWYDAVEVGANRILFSIGDVAGHGLEAAVAMSRVRSAMLSSALLDGTPAAILQSVNALLRAGAAEAPMVTAVVGIADAHTYEFIYSTAGHPPPALLEPGRPPRLLPFGGLPLGVSDKAAYRTHRIQTVPGAMLVLYTDGVTEHSRDAVEGERLLLEALSGLTDQAEAANVLYQTLLQDKPPSDDVAILTLAFEAGRPSGLAVGMQDEKPGTFGLGEDRSSSVRPALKPIGMRRERLDALRRVS